MAITDAESTSPLEVYQRMQTALLQGEGYEATLLPQHLVSEDLVVETPFATPGTRRFEGRDAWLSHYRIAGAGLLVTFEQFRELATHHTADPEVLVVEYEISARVNSTGVHASVQCIAILRVRDGRIAHWREYQDVLSITEALTRPAPQA